MTIPVLHGRLTNGLSDVASHLGIRPESSVFIHSTIIGDSDSETTSSARKQISSFPRRYMQMLGYMPRDEKTGQARACMFDVASDLLEYLEESRLLFKSNIISVGAAPEQSIYPHASIPHNLLKGLEGKRIAEHLLSDSTLVSSFLSKDETTLAERFRLNLLMSPIDQPQFNSKVNLRKWSRENEYDVPLGVEVEEEGDIAKKIASLLGEAYKCGVDAKKVKWWVKMDSQSSGDGSFCLDGINENSLSLIQEHFQTVARRMGSCWAFFPFVIEIDVANYPQTRVLANVGVQSVIAEHQIVLCGSTLQKTMTNGRYIGCEIGDQFENDVAVAEKSATPALRFFQQQGYRGFLNLDVLVSENSVTHQKKGYIIDPNARFSGGTPLSSLFDYVKSKNEAVSHAMMFSNNVPCPKNGQSMFLHLSALCGSDLYQGEGTSFCGILPLIFNEVGGGKSPDMEAATVFVFGENAGHSWEQYNRYKHSLKP